jgi:hypothetical protein
VYYITCIAPPPPPPGDITSIIPAEAEDIVMPDEPRRAMSKRAAVVTALWNQRGAFSIL